ncbi:MAG: 30S ribosomal protein S17 [Candidatus Levybacteria bacterium]|nr:30S ribosomal protein S17 [Candidatus Levybacteria bacterium]
MKTLKGIVLSKNMEKTAVVVVEQIKIHSLYKKRFKRHQKYKVDTGEMSVSVGDTVRITETKPISKEKHFRIMEVLK